MNEAGYSVKQGKTAKSQVSEVIRALQEKSTLPIQRARMRIRVVVPNEYLDAVKEKITQAAETIEDEKTGEEWESVSLPCTPSTLFLTTGFDRHYLSSQRNSVSSAICCQRSAKERAGWKP
jgi:ribosome maturation protein Sdo1